MNKVKNENLKILGRLVQDGAQVSEPPTPKGEHICGLQEMLPFSKRSNILNNPRMYSPLGVGGSEAFAECAKITLRWVKSPDLNHYPHVSRRVKITIASLLSVFEVFLRCLCVGDAGIMGTSQRLVPAAFHRWAILLFIVATGILGLKAQPLDSLVQIALRQNPELKARYTRYQSQLERAPQQSQLADPQLDFSTQFLPLRMRTWEQAAIIGGMQEFPWPGTLSTRSALTLSEARVTYEQAEVEALNLRYEVKMAWLEYYLAVNSIRFLEESITLSRSAERLALARVESGRGNATEVLKVQLKIRQQEQQLNLLKNRTQFPQYRLNQLLNRPAQTPIQLKETLTFEILPFQMDSLLQQIKQEHPAISSLRYEKEASRQMEALNRLEGKPDIGLGLDYVVMSKITEHGLTSDGKDMVMPRIGIRLPLYRKKYEAKAREEQLRRESLDLEAQALGNDFAANLGRAMSLQEEARLTHEFVQEQLKTLDALIKMQEGNFSTNADLYESLLENYELRLEYQLMDLDAIVKVQQAKAEVEKLRS